MGSFSLPVFGDVLGGPTDQGISRRTHHPSDGACKADALGWVHDRTVRFVVVVPFPFLFCVCPTYITYGVFRHPLFWGARLSASVSALFSPLSFFSNLCLGFTPFFFPPTSVPSPIRPLPALHARICSDLGTEGAADADIALRKCLSSKNPHTNALIPGPRYFCASRAIVPTGSYGTSPPPLRPYQRLSPFSISIRPLCPPLTNSYPSLLPFSPLVGRPPPPLFSTLSSQSPLMG